MRPFDLCGRHDEQRTIAFASARLTSACIVSSSVPGASHRESLPASSTTESRVLVVDDDPSIRRLLAALVAVAGFACDVAAAIGHRMLRGSDIELLDAAAVIAWTHHERYDGGGYPRGLAGVADVFDALTTDRVYRRAMPVDEAVIVLCSPRGCSIAAQPPRHA
jgi:hypothetical protein